MVNSVLTVQAGHCTKSSLCLLPADNLGPTGARPSAGIVMTPESHIYFLISFSGYQWFLINFSWQHSKWPQNLNQILEHLTCLTHWGRVTHICVSKLTIIGSDNGLAPVRQQAIIWTNAGILLIGPLGTNVSEILIEIHAFSLKKCITLGPHEASVWAKHMHFHSRNAAFENVVWKMAAILSLPQCVKGVNTSSDEWASSMMSIPHWGLFLSHFF